MDTLRMSVFLPVVVFLLAWSSTLCGADYELTLLHTNDVHARFEEFNKYGSECSPEDAAEAACFGGVARRATMVKKIRNTVQNVLFLDAGDQYQGTMWFFLYKGEATSHFMNMLGYDAMAIGNHEFDNEPEGLGPFLRNTTFPVLSCNIDASKEPSIHGHFEKSIERNVNGERIGIIGYTYYRTHEISSSGECVFYPEVESIQREVDAFVADGINKIIAVGHSGILIDQEIAANVVGVDVVIGGHTDTFLYTGEPPEREEPYGEYPLVIDQQGGGRALVVQDFTFGKYLGRLNVTFNDAGEVIAFEGNPILLDSSTEEDPEVMEEIESWASLVRNSSGLFVGISHAFLEGERPQCRARECNLGNLIADGMVSQNNKNPDELQWNDVGIALMNGGSIRASISQGDITHGDIANVMPFGNTIDVLELQGVYLLQALENSVSMYDLATLDGRFLQYSGLRVVYDLRREPGNRVVEALAICTNCTVPHYEPLDLNRIYKIVIHNFLAQGGDGYSMIRDNKMNHVTGNLDSAVFAEYIERLTPVAPAIEGRITLLDENTPTLEPCAGGAFRLQPSPLLALMTSLAYLSLNVATRL